jgi:hypothetical protein
VSNSRSRCPGADAVVGNGDEGAVLQPVVIGELITALERVVCREEVFRQIDDWLDDRAGRLTG